jgi:hypothetical protein
MQCILHQITDAYKTLTGRLTTNIQLLRRRTVDICINKGRGKAVPLQAWSGPEGSTKLRFLNFTTTAQGGGKVVSLTHGPTLPPANTPGTHFC